MTTWTEPLVYNSETTLDYSIRFEPYISTQTSTVSSVVFANYFVKISMTASASFTYVISLYQSTQLSTNKYEVAYSAYNINLCGNYWLSATPLTLESYSTGVTIAYSKFVSAYQQTNITIKSTQACKGSTAQVITYYLQGWDTTTNNFVYWQSVGTPNSSPTSTTPALVGTLTNITITSTQTIAQANTYYLRGWDTTTNSFVYWQSIGTPNISPISTTPSLVGTLTNVCVVGTMQS